MQRSPSLGFNWKRNNQPGSPSHSSPGRSGAGEDEGVYPHNVENTKKPILFGDAFGSKADYSKGDFYSGRNRYLHSSNDENNLLGPPELMTRRQAKLKLLLSRQETQLSMHKLEFKTINEDDANKRASLAISKKEAQAKRTQKNLANKLIVLHSPADINPSDWSEKFQCGVRYWVNNKTKETSNFCPWEQPTSQNGILHNNCSSEKKEEEVAAGAMVYDGTAMEEFLTMLDQMDISSNRAGSKQSKK